MPLSFLTSKDKGTNAGDEAREKGVEWEGSYETAVRELYNARQHHVRQIGVHELEFGGRARPVALQELADDGEEAFGAHFSYRRLAALV